MTQQHPGTAARFVALLGLALWAAQPAHAQFSAIADGIPAGDEQLDARLASYTEAREASFLDWLPDGSLLVSTRFGTRAQVHRVAFPLGMREQLTYFPGPVQEVTAPHAGEAEGFAFTRDLGDSQPQLYWYALKTRSVQMLSSGGFQHGSPVWSKDGQHVAFVGTERGPTAYDIYAADLGSDTAPRLLIGSTGRPWQPLDWSADGRLLLWQPADGTLYLADSASGAITPVDPSGQLRDVQGARFAPDGRGVYFISTAGKPSAGLLTARKAAASANDAAGDFSQLRLFDLTTHQVRDITTGSWDVEDFDVGADGRYLAYVTNENGRSRLTVLDTLHRLESRPAGLPDGIIQHPRFDGSGRKLAFSAESPLSPRDVYVFEPESNTLTRWTRSEPGLTDPQSFVDAQPIRFATWDSGASGQRQIPAFLYQPRVPGRHPVLVMIHDGPDSQARPQFDGFIQFAVHELGYTVITPNIRGSSGYGRAFSQLDDGPLRDDALRDVGALLVWIGQQPQLDRAHVVIMGQSFGGLMALDAMATWGDRLQGGIDLAGITSLPDFLKTAPVALLPGLRSELGNEYDAKMRAAQSRLSPIQNLAQIRRPLLVVQSLNDSPSQVNQSGQLVASLRSRGIEAWWLQLRSEGRTLDAAPDRDAWWQAAAQFLKKLAAAPAAR